MLVGLFVRRRDLGARGEAVAAKHLRGRGYRLLARNLRSRAGELDLVAEAPDGRTVVIVEVKAGRVGNPMPEVHVNAAKRKKLVALAHALVRRMELRDRPIRFDVIAVEFGEEGAEPIVRHHAGAFHGGW